MVALIEEHRAELEALCREFAVRRLEVFGSATDARFDPARSDVDFLVDFDRGAGIRPFRQYMGFLLAAEDLLGRKVDLVEDAAIDNPHFRQAVDAQREPVYAA
jgi:predicted nucleotidyltransferase